MLKGIRVIDFSRFIPGSYAGQRLADLGAEVIKIESPGTGDPTRAKDGGLPFFAHNRNKKSVTLNLKQPEGQQLAFQLGCKADVIIESFRPGAAAALGIGYQAFKRVNPGIIYCSLTGLGQSGPLSTLGSHDLNYQAVSGILAQLTDKSGRPIIPKFQIGDLIGGIAASEAVLAALVKRSVSSEGSYLDCAISDFLMGMMSVHTIIQSALGTREGIAELSGKIISYNLYETADGRYISLSAVEDKFWENFCRAAGRSDWMGKQFTPAENSNPIYVEITAFFKSRNFAQWLVFSEEADCCMAPVLETDEVVNSPYAQERGLLTITMINDVGMIQTKTSAGGFTPEGKDLREWPVPALGEHTAEVLSGLLSADPAKIEDWRKRGIIST